MITGELFLLTMSLKLCMLTAHIRAYVHAPCLLHQSQADLDEDLLQQVTYSVSERPEHRLVECYARVVANRQKALNEAIEELKRWDDDIRAQEEAIAKAAEDNKGKKTTATDTLPRRSTLTPSETDATEECGSSSLDDSSSRFSLASDDAHNKEEDIDAIIEGGFDKESNGLNRSLNMHDEPSHEQIGKVVDRSSMVEPEE